MAASAPDARLVKAVVMAPWLVSVMVVVVAAGAALLVARWRRQGLYRELRSAQERLSATRGAPVRPCATPDLAAARRSFAATHLAVLADALDVAEFDRLLRAAERLVATERSYLPMHKKGGTVANETITRQAPELAALYLGPLLRDLVARITGVEVVPTPVHDQSSLSLLVYERPGDHINWHFDHNFYRGRHFTLLIPLVNHGTDIDRLSHARLIARVGGEERVVATPPNTIVLFEGAKVLHKVTPIHDGERRIVLSMTYTTDPAAAWWQGVLRRFKDIGFFGLRALWT
jgi:hypothetical protein